MKLRAYDEQVGGSLQADEPELEAIVEATHRRPGPLYLLGLALAGGAAAGGFYSFSLVFRKGLYLTGLGRPVCWGNLITDFVFWVGIAHSGTLISAILFLFRARLRTAVYRIAEMMTVFAVMTAGLFPIFHLGRPWLAYWLVPYPNQRGLWINFRSPLVWDVFAVSTYLTVSVIFLLVGVAPDAALLRDRARGWRRRLYAALALGWRGGDEQWRHYSRAYLYLAALATPLVLSVHSVVSWDFASSLIPGWHGTIFAPDFVAGAIYSGVGMVFTLLIPLRKYLTLEHMITDYHFDNMSKLTLLTGTILFYAYGMEYFVAWYSGNTFEQTTFFRRAFGPQWWGGWTMIICNAFVSQLLWFRKVRTNLTALFVISIFINIGMWFERYVIIQSLTNDYIPYAWDQMTPTWADWGILAGSFGWFGRWFLLFAKTFPIVAIQEIKEFIPMPRLKGGHGGHH